MKRCMGIIGKALVLAVISLLVSCAGTQGIRPEAGEQTVDMGHYTVNRPPGENWKIETERDKRTVRFLRQPRSLFGGGLPVVMIQVSQNWVVSEKWSLNEEETANDFRKSELSGMVIMGVLPGNYGLREVRHDTMTIEGRKLYTMSYKTLGGRLFGTDKIQEATLYLYFPPDFRDSHIFYNFVMSEVHDLQKPRESDPSLIFPVIDSVRSKGNP